MKNITFRRCGTIILSAASLLFAPLGQAQHNNPTGPAGIFNGNSNTGGSFCPFTANASRTVVDISVAAAVVPMQWSRTMNSRNPGVHGFGSGGGWTHSYDWSIDPSETFDVPIGTPTYYRVSFPDGRVINFAYSASDTCFRGPLGVHERLQPLNLTSMLAYLILSDGGKVEFKAERWKYHDPDDGTWSSGYTYQAQAMIDPNGLRTTFTYNADGTLSRVAEPAGRWLQINYASGRISQVLAGYGTNTLTQIVGYTYGTFNGYSVLKNANYSDGTGASYSYQASNVAAAIP